MFSSLETGEVGYQSRSDEKNLYNKSVTWHPNFENPQKTSIEIEATKTNRWKHETEIIHAHCNCDKSRRIIPGPVHSSNH